MSHLLLVAAILVTSAACTTTARTCVEIPFSAEAEGALASAEGELNFTPYRPCASAGSFVVSSVILDVLPRGERERRITFIVSRRGEEAYQLSETRDLMPFSAIPAGTQHVQVTVGDVTARGFSGPSQDGYDFAYVRWRIDEVTYELSARIRPWLTEADVRRIVAEQMRAVLEAGG